MKVTLAILQSAARIFGNILLLAVSSVVFFYLLDQTVIGYLNRRTPVISSLDSSVYGERLEFNRYHPILGYDGIPFISKTFAGKLVTHNSLGDRSPEYLCEGNSSPHLLLLGDSQAWGYGVDNDHTIRTLLEKKFNNAHEDAWRIVNFGVSGYGPDQSLLKYLLRGRCYRPRIVVFLLFVSNDFGELGSDVFLERW